MKTVLVALETVFTGSYKEGCELVKFEADTLEEAMAEAELFQKVREEKYPDSPTHIADYNRIAQHRRNKALVAYVKDGEHTGLGRFDQPLTDLGRYDRLYLF